ncbi:MAG: hypothetical protein H0T79_03020 [Deltaproteobacteria bacterium]|nr:hypothetical protein [Deltaproteobacteria bacterium]
MRWFAVIVFVSLVTSSAVLAKPKAGVTPVSGVGGDKVGTVLVEALEDSTTVVGPREVEKAMDKLGLSGELDAKDVKKLQKKLGTTVVVQGKVAKAGKKHTLTLGVFVRGKKPTELTLQYKSASSVKFREDVKELVQQIAMADAKDEDDDDDKPKRKPSDDDDDKPKRKPKDDDDKPKIKPKADDDDKPKRVARDDDDDARKRRRKRGGGDDDESSVRAAPNPLMRAALRVDAGGSFGVRRLTYDTTTTGGPPPVGTGAGGARIEGELYPFALGDPKSALAGLGVTGEYDKTVGLTIRAPGTTTDVSIDQGHYALGARYRIGVGEGSSVALGVAYARRHYIADRTMAQLDLPDVDYTAVAPGIGFRAPATPSIGVFANADVLLMLSTGQIQERTSYGPADVFGVAADAGVDVALSKSLALRFAAEYSQINFTFKKPAGNRGVTGATDRSIGLAATLAVLY